MEKIKNIGSRVFDWIKKHRVLSILLCLLLIIFCFKGIVWIYNDIAYGRFVKVGEIKKLKDILSYIKINDNELMLFAPIIKNHKLINQIYLYKIKEKKK